MARRKRLSFDTVGLETKSLTPDAVPEARVSPSPLAGALRRSAPIAQVAGESAAQAALATLTQELEEARASGRLILRLELDQIDVGHLQRDRLTADPQEMEDLIASISARGQQMPIEVSALPEGRFGLISGWRRVSALRHLHTTTLDARFAQVLAIVRSPETMAEAYRAMVEENEIRAAISYYERARIAALAAEAGVYADPRAAIAGLFAAASRAKRSKIGSFLTIWQSLDGRLRFGPAIPERLGLALARALDADVGFGRRLGDRLRKSPPDSATAELALLERALASGDETASETASETVSKPAAPKPPAPQPVSEPPSDTASEEIRPGIVLETSGGFLRSRLVLSGDKVDSGFRARLVDWLKTQS